MTRYIVLYRAPQNAVERFAQATPAEAQAGMKAWVEWGDRLGPALVDPGGPLGRTILVDPASTTETRTDIIGMSVLQAPSMDAALAMLEDHHHLHWAEQCTITVHEQMPIPEMANGVG